MYICICSFLVLLSLIATQAHGGESITGGDPSYRQICQQAANNLHFFLSFRSLPQYSNAVEMPGGAPFAEYITRNASKEILKKLPSFEKLDTIGSPKTTDFPNMGKFSGTTLRYIVIADQIKKLFFLPRNAKVVEIGAGFGGQCYILSQLQLFHRYYIYDLPEAGALIARVMEALRVQNVHLMPMDAALPEQTVDLLISNYAYSECNRETQLDYFDRVIKKADRGYVLYNQIATRVFKMDSLTPHEFVDLLEAHGMHPKIHNEPIPTAEDNLLITWDRTQGCPKVL